MKSSRRGKQKINTNLKEEKMVGKYVKADE